MEKTWITIEDISPFITENNEHQAVRRSNHKPMTQVFEIKTYLIMIIMSNVKTKAVFAATLACFAFPSPSRFPILNK